MMKSKNRNILAEMMPSLQLPRRNIVSSSSSAASKCGYTKKRTRLKMTAALVALVALVAIILLLTLGLCFRLQFNVDKSGIEVVTYVKTHPKNVIKLDNKDVFISVKTTHKNHHNRLNIVISTWYQLARDHTWFFTDKSDPEVEAKTRGHLVVTNCAASHSRQDLCCKMAAEFDAFLESGKKWFCHFDDDNYVNVPSLVDKLRQFDHRQDWYLGKVSLSEPLEIFDRDSSSSQNGIQQPGVKFWFATGGAGFCLSQSLSLKMMPLIGGGKFESVGDKIRLPDDVTMGYVAEHLLKVPLTVIDDFHSHMEPHKLLPTDERLADAISYSYFSKDDQPISNVLCIDGGFSLDEDPTRFLSLHCKLFPNFSWCPRLL